MRLLLNLCCGATRPQSDEWQNIDQLHPVLALGTPERAALDAEPYYTEADVTKGLPYPAESFDGILASHCVEHWDCMTAVDVMRECRRVLKPNGVLLVSVPDASYFRRVYAEDTPENAVRLFGEPIHLPDGETTFFGYALWNRWHKAILTEDALWCYFVRAGFERYAIYRQSTTAMVMPEIPDALSLMQTLLNRPKFSLAMSGVRT